MDRLYTIRLYSHSVRAYTRVEHATSIRQALICHCGGAVNVLEDSMSVFAEKLQAAVGNMKFKSDWQKLQEKR